MKRKKQISQPEQSGETRIALALCDDLLDMIEDLPPHDWGLGERLTDRVRSIATLIEESNSATTGQMQTLTHLELNLERRTRRC